jgi:type II secretory pathway component PulC
MRRLSIRITNLALFILCCFLLAEVANKISAELLLPRSSSVMPPAAVPETPARSWEERKPILQRNLFGAQVVSQPILDVEPEPEEIAKTELPLELLGTIASSNKAMSRATIWDKSNREHQVLRAGDSLKHHSEVRLERIERRRVILINDERREELSLDDREPSPEVASVRKPTPPRKGRMARRRPARRSSARPQESQAEREEREEAVSPFEAVQEEIESGQLDKRDLLERLNELRGR